MILLSKIKWVDHIYIYCMGLFWSLFGIQDRPLLATNFPAIYRRILPIWSTPPSLRHIFFTIYSSTSFLYSGVARYYNLYDYIIHTIFLQQVSVFPYSLQLSALRYHFVSPTIIRNTVILSLRSTNNNYIFSNNLLYIYTD